MKGLSYSQFADSCGIPRPSLSQLLTGRNKKINDIMVGQIHNSFPELSIVWLLFGEGNMENQKASAASQSGDSITDAFPAPKQIDTFDTSGSKRIVFNTNTRPSNENSKENGLNRSMGLSQDAEYQISRLQNRIKELQSQIDHLRKNPRKAVQIMVYYDDSTFETFIPR